MVFCKGDFVLCVEEVFGDTLLLNVVLVIDSPRLFIFDKK